MKVSYNDGTDVVVRVSPKVQVQFERHFKKSMFDYGLSPLQEENFYLAWLALRDAGKDCPDDFEAFLDLIDDVDPVRDTPTEPNEGVNPEPDPTRRVPQPENSST
jgi:hypothetical protein